MKIRILLKSLAATVPTYGTDGAACFDLYAAEPVKVYAKQSAVVPTGLAVEAAYWDFDARHKGYGPHKTMPQSERDAFKWAVRAMLAAAIRAMKDKT